MPDPRGADGCALPISARSVGLFAPRLLIRGAILRPLRAVRDDALAGARDAALQIAQCALQTVTQDVKPASMPAGACGVGHGCLSMVMVTQYAPDACTHGAACLLGSNL